MRRAATQTSDVAGLVVVVTGAARGIGAEVSRQLVARGARVGLVDVDEEALLALADDLGEGALAVPADVTDLVALDTAVAMAVERFGGLDVVVANAGIEVLGPIESMAPADFDRVVEVDLLGVWRTIRACLPAIERRRGYVIVVTSVAGVTQGPFNAAYSSAKAGVVAIARTLRLEVRSRGVAVGIVYFGYVATETARRSVSHPAMAPIMARMPRRAREPVPVERAAAAIVKAIERRADRVVVPASMTPAVLFPEFAQALGERWLGRGPVRWRE